ncbi:MULTISPECIES: hypothetical protein [Flavobacterium]|jgi:hypothetical protein|uniref:Uncharacterized protein n=1 Tax=Flavobacterium cupriresistens TaxID=2893885 RepID=A0ABU4RCX0_9FLAO|nr:MULTISPECIES: hypothetical protein [unclassified Flavobacterium]KLT69732.1 hypothetical protein AB674_10775 [Flavobacterium sp. ABG]MDX6189519.1 hypothetical protein [Flavobacterium sp. Fl-318]UFH41072.1 hypothetical protein LNP23_14775 [Flavobacterium sp. F-323]
MSLPNELYNTKFAEYIESLKILYLVDDKFKTICDEYSKSRIKTEKYRKKFEKDFRNQLEFENLSKELEEEILIYLIRKE